MSGRGRGRGLTLPAWMTSGTVTLPSQGDSSSNPDTSGASTSTDDTAAAAAPPAAISTVDRFDDAKPEPTIQSRYNASVTQISHTQSQAAQPQFVAHVPSSHYPGATAMPPVMPPTMPTGYPGQQPMHAAAGYHNPSAGYGGYGIGGPVGVAANFNMNNNRMTATAPGLGAGYNPHLNTMRPPSAPIGPPPFGIPTQHQQHNHIQPGYAPFNPPFQRPPMYPPQNHHQPQQPQQPAIDPSNDVTNWTEHVVEDGSGRRYWYNKVTLVSTYDKPFILKTPEERSIPPCKWKEYVNAADGKKYYSDGTASLWEMPEEFRVWKERVEAAELKKRNSLLMAAQPPQPPSQPQSQQPSTTAGVSGTGSAANVSGDSSTGTVASGVVGANTASAQGTSGAGNGGHGGGRGKQQQPLVPLEFATHAEAVEAFISLLSDKKVSTTAKLKDIKDSLRLEEDARWLALKSSGERNQALAEYQTKRLKLEKEAKATKAKKARDNFLVMLAEKTDIDTRSRWSEASALLKDDMRYKNVEDPREREDLFNDFVAELAKKSREDRIKTRETALKTLQQTILPSLQASGALHRHSLWLDCKEAVMAAMVSHPQGNLVLKGLEDTDLKRATQDFVIALDTAFKESERLRKENAQKTLDKKLADFAASISDLFARGALTVNFSANANSSSNSNVGSTVRWKDVCELPVVATLRAVQEVNEYLQEIGGNNSGTSTSKSSATPPLQLQGSLRETFERVVDSLKQQQRNDRRLIREAVEVVFSRDGQSKSPQYAGTGLHAVTYESLKPALLNLVGLYAVDTSSKKASSQAILCQLDGQPVIAATDAVEDGEEDPHKLILTQLRKLIVDRPHSLAPAVQELIEIAQEDFEEEQRRIKKYESRFLALLTDYFNRSDHVGTPWEDAKRMLERHSAYDQLPRHFRKRLYAEYMEELKKKVEAKHKSMEVLRQQQRQPMPAVEAAVVEEDRRGTRGTKHSRRSRSRSVSMSITKPVSDAPQVSTTAGLKHDSDSGSDDDSDSRSAGSGNSSDGASDDDSDYEDHEGGEQDGPQADDTVASSHKSHKRSKDNSKDSSKEHKSHRKHSHHKDKDKDSRDGKKDRKDKVKDKKRGGDKDRSKERERGRSHSRSRSYDREKSGTSNSRHKKKSRDLDDDDSRAEKRSRKH